MAMIKCPECEQQISDKAVRCPKCGFPIKETPQQNANLELTMEEKSENSSAVLETVTTDEKKKNRKWIPIAIGAIVLIVALVVGCILFVPNIYNIPIQVDEIKLSKWRLADSTEYSDYFEGIVSSEQEAPFVAVIGRYDDESNTPEFVYVEDGIGTFETSVSTDEDPSLIYKPVGYIAGTRIQASDIDVSFSDSDYYDMDFSSEFTSCRLEVSMEMKNAKTGILVYDFVNDTNDETVTNKTAIVVNGKAECLIFAELPYKARGIECSIVPKMFCESKTITEENYTKDKAFTVEKYEGDYSQSYSGEEILKFTDYEDGFIIYTEELKDGGNKENRNKVENRLTFLHNEKCSITTYDVADIDEKLLLPKYGFGILGYLTWTKV